MYRRLIILSVIIVAALCGLSWLGYRAISMWVQGIEGTRITEFANVAEQIRLDVKDKLDAFMEQEQSRPYTDYQYYTVPEDSFYTYQEDKRKVQDALADDYSRRRSEISNVQSAPNIGDQQQITLMPSPLAGSLENGFAYFNFQYDTLSKSITTPNYKIEPQQPDSLSEADIKFNNEVGINALNVRDNLLPVLRDTADSSIDSSKKTDVLKERLSDSKKESEPGFSKTPSPVKSEELKKEFSEQEKEDKSIAAQEKGISNTKAAVTKTTSRTGSYNIESFQNTNAEPQVQKQSRDYVTNMSQQNQLFEATEQAEIINKYQQSANQQSLAIDEQSTALQQINRGTVLEEQQVASANETQQMAGRGVFGGGMGGMSGARSAAGGRGGRQSSAGELGFGGRSTQTLEDSESPVQADTILDTRNEITSTTTGRSANSLINVHEGTQAPATVAQREQNQPIAAEPNQSDIIEVRIEPFTPIVVKGENDKDSIFGGQVFMVRRVKYEGKELIQGFQLNEKKLLEEVEESTKRFVRAGMSYELGRNQNESSAYTAILDFGFGHLLLNLFEDDPGRFMLQISHLRTWYFSIISIVFLAVTLAVVSLWLNARAQIKLAQKKDDFVSAVSHELRTPLTSIRMHAEMLEKNWIKSENKLGEYYRSMRTESERLTRLIENVLDFSRIQKGRKKYFFKLGDINKCVTDVAEMMAAYAAQRGFQIKTQLGECREIAFDSDAVTQIVVNLLDNAVKYSSNSNDKTITVRTRSDDEFVLIEVEDHGPGIPHRQRKKVFQEFYRIGAEATRETSGSGLGLALVKKFAQAHNGFVEIFSAKPTGAIFRVSLAAHPQDA